MSPQCIFLISKSIEIKKHRAFRPIEGKLWLVLSERARTNNPELSFCTAEWGNVSVSPLCVFLISKSVEIKKRRAFRPIERTPWLVLSERAHTYNPGGSFCTAESWLRIPVRSGRKCCCCACRPHSLPRCLRLRIRRSCGPAAPSVRRLLPGPWV